MQESEQEKKKKNVIHAVYKIKLESLNSSKVTQCIKENILSLMNDGRTVSHATRFIVKMAFEKQKGQTFYSYYI